MVGRILALLCVPVATFSSGTCSLGLACFEVRGTAHETALGEVDLGFLQESAVHGRSLFRWGLGCMGKGFYRPPTTGGQFRRPKKEGTGALTRSGFITLT